MILMRFRRSLPAIVARTVFPKSSSMENIPALNFSTTLPITSIASSFGKLFLYIYGIERGCGPFGTAPASHPDSTSVFAASRRRCRDTRRPIRVPLSERASLTFSIRPSTSLPFRPLIAAVPSASYAHFDKSEAPGLSRVTVSHDVHAVDRTVRLKHGTHSILRGSETEVTYKNILHFNFFPEFAEQRTGKTTKSGALCRASMGACAIGRTGKDIYILAQIRVAVRGLAFTGRGIPGFTLGEGRRVTRRPCGINPAPYRRKRSPSLDSACGFLSTTLPHEPQISTGSKQCIRQFQRMAFSVPASSSIGAHGSARRRFFRASCSFGLAPAHSSGTLTGEYKTASSDLLKSIHLWTMSLFLPARDFALVLSTTSGAVNNRASSWYARIAAASSLPIVTPVNSSACRI